MDKQILKKYIVRVKFLLRKQYKNQESCVSYSRRCKNIIEFNKEYIKDLKSIDDKIKNIFTLKDIKEIESNNKELEENILNTKEKLGEINKEIYDYGNMILDISNYIDKYFNLQEKIHLISGNTESCKGIIKFYKEHEKSEPMFLDLIIQHGEYQNNKQREKDWIDCPNYEMPLFNAIQLPMIERMKNGGYSILDSPLFEQMPYYTKDSNGNLKKNEPEVVRQDGNVTIVRF